MTCDYLALAAPGVRGIHPYQPGKPISELERELGIGEIIKLASNENPLGPSPKAVKAMAGNIGDLALYPDGSGFLLKQAIAEKFRVSPECITLGNGSNDVLVLLAEAFLSQASSAVYSEYCFAVYPIAVQAVGAEARVASATTPDHPMPMGHDLEAMAGLVDESTRVVFIANPNNPTGTWLPMDKLHDFVSSMPAHTLVVVDEAYYEYARQAESAVDWLDDFPNLVVCRTFSKAYGLAGIRVGYCLSNPEVSAVLNRVRQPFNVNSLAQIAAVAALDDADFLRMSRELNDAGLEQLSLGLGKLGIGTLPSAGNFLLADMGEDAGVIYDYLLRAGVIVRPVANYGLPNHLRITVGTDIQNQVLLDALARRQR